jgi:hypothetical protein
MSTAGPLLTNILIVAPPVMRQIEMFLQKKQAIIAVPVDIALIMKEF